MTKTFLKGQGSRIRPPNRNAFTPFAFDHPATYTFEIRDQRERSGNLVWDVESIEGDRITMRIVFTFEGETQEKTMTFARDDAFAQVAFSPGGHYAMTTIFSSSMSSVYEKDLRVGQSWTAVSGEGTMRYDVVEKRNYAGVECYFSQIRMNGSVSMEGCYAPNHGVAPYGAYYDDSGTQLVEVKLASYERK
ncbi:hypothetical protein [Haladaptatus sp. NG-SE-30]